jgi:hypothetical protein
MERRSKMSRVAIILMALLVALTVPGLSASGSDAEAVLGREDDGVAVLVAGDDDDGDDTNTTNGTTGTNGTDSIDTTAERSRSLDRSADNTGNPNGQPDRSNSKDRSRDNTKDHSRGVTTND